jgi:hypothetical protein
MAAAPQVLRFDSWAGFRDAITAPRFAAWAFRGQGDAGWPLACSLHRHFHAFGVDRRAWRAQEERILRVFRRKAGNYLAHVPAPDDHFQWLALMEHHGAPTRLLDLTWSPYVASFFALEPATARSAVWAIDPQAALRHAGRTARTAAARLDPRDPAAFARHYLAGRRPFVWIGEPEAMNRRLIAQSGTFAVASVIDRSIDEIIAGYDPRAVVKFELARAVREPALRELYSMNITQATLFPDLDGLARSLAYELEFHWEFDPHTMRAWRGDHPG